MLKNLYGSITLLTVRLENDTVSCVAAFSCDIASYGTLKTLSGHFSHPLCLKNLGYSTNLCYLLGNSLLILLLADLLDLSLFTCMSTGLGLSVIVSGQHELQQTVLVCDFGV